MRGEEIYYLIKIVIKTAPLALAVKFNPMGNPWGPMGPPMVPLSAGFCFKARTSAMFFWGSELRLDHFLKYF